MRAINDFKRRLIAKQKAESGEVDALLYEEVPDFLRTQMRHLLIESGFTRQDGRGSASDRVHKSYLLEDQVYYILSEHVKKRPRANTTEIVLDVLEICEWDLFVSLIETSVKELSSLSLKEEVNRLFRQQCFGFEIHHRREFLFDEYGSYRNHFEALRIDDAYVHAEVVKPALRILTDKRFEVAQGEFLKAHEAYLHGDFATAIAEVNKSYESVLKVVCEIMGYEFDEKRDTASKLVKILFKSGYFPPYLGDYATHVQKILDSGVNTIRNREASHGKGSDKRKLTQPIAKLAMHTTASLIVFLVDMLPR